MKKLSCLITLSILLLGSALSANAQTADKQDADKKKASTVQKALSHFEFHGFIRSYFAFDTRESSAGTEDLYYYMPKDVNISASGEDLNEQMSFRFAALTSRVWVDIKGFQFDAWKVGGRIEADFYAGLNGTTGTAQLRLRQAYVSIARETRTWKIGQTWHPMAADLPDIFSLETGAPFGPFNRSPQINLEWNYAAWGGLTAAAIWQMQYTSTGPAGASADYIKYGLTPEFYLGLNFKTSKSLFRIGGDILSIKPRWNNATWNSTDKKWNNDGTSKVKDRLTTFNAFVYAQTKADNWTFKGKVTYAQDGGHMNLVGGYGVTGFLDDGISWSYTPTQTVSGWFTAMAKFGAWQPQMLLGYLENFGCYKGISNTVVTVPFWQKNNASTLARMYRIQPELIYNLGKLQFGLEYMLTAAHYGEADAYKHAVTNLHWVLNHRVQAMVKFNF